MINELHKGVSEEIRMEIPLPVALPNPIVSVVHLNYTLDIPGGGFDLLQFLVHHIDKVAIKLRPLTTVFRLRIVGVVLLNFILHHLPNVFLGVLELIKEYLDEVIYQIVQ